VPIKIALNGKQALTWNLAISFQSGEFQVNFTDRARSPLPDERVEERSRIPAVCPDSSRSECKRLGQRPIRLECREPESSYSRSNHQHAAPEPFLANIQRHRPVKSVPGHKETLARPERWLDLAADPVSVGAPAATPRQHQPTTTREIRSCRQRNDFPGQSLRIETGRTSSS